jgi:hypothetical protein
MLVAFIGAAAETMWSRARGRCGIACNRGGAQLLRQAPPRAGGVPALRVSGRRGRYAPQRTSPRLLLARAQSPQARLGGCDPLHQTSPRTAAFKLGLGSGTFQVPEVPRVRRLPGSGGNAGMWALLAPVNTSPGKISSHTSVSASAPAAKHPRPRSKNRRARF